LARNFADVFMSKVERREGGLFFFFCFIFLEEKLEFVVLRCSPEVELFCVVAFMQ
jgi:hypothetical protein